MNWKIKKAKKPRERGFDNGRIALAMIISKGEVDNLIGPWVASLTYRERVLGSAHRDGSFVDKEHLSWLLANRIPDWTYDDQNDPTGRIEAGRENALGALDKMSEKDVEAFFAFSNLPNVNLSGAIELWMESLALLPSQNKKATPSSDLLAGCLAPTIEILDL